MAAPLRFGLVGYKFMGKAHSNALSRIPMFFDTDRPIQRKILCGRDAEWAGQAARRLGWQEVETDWRALVAREDIDCVDITAPSNVHKEIALPPRKTASTSFARSPWP